jgi:hypothetical protein
MPCLVRPEPFTRYAADAGVGFAEVGALFTIGRLAEGRRRRGESRDWW